ncbi:MAG: response regulator transcription factor [Blastocatellia bacterium]|nr:response regulator transcription factor [Blastocatellia bacterium]
MPQEIRIVIADDHPVFRQGLALMIGTNPLLQVVGEAQNGAEAVSVICHVKPDVVVLDIDMPEKNGFSVVRELQAREVQSKVMFLTMHRDEALFNGAFDLGVQGYLLKDSALADIINGIKAVAAGENFISPALSTFLINRIKRTAASGESRSGVQDLTETQRRILLMIAEDKSTREIADTLCISPRTVDNHRANICQKLNLRGANALLKFALANKNKLV